MRIIEQQRTVSLDERERMLKSRIDDGEVIIVKRAFQIFSLEIFHSNYPIQRFCLTSDTSDNIIHYMTITLTK